MMCKLIKILCIFLLCFSLKDVLVVSEIDVADIEGGLKLAILSFVPPPLMTALGTFAFIVKLTHKKKDEVKLKDVIGNLTAIKEAIGHIESRLDSQVQQISDEIIKRQDIMDSETRIRIITDAVDGLYDSLVESWDVSASNESLLRHAIDYSSQTANGLMVQLKALVSEVVPTNRHKPEDGILRKILYEMTEKFRQGLWCGNTRSFNDYIGHRYKVFAETITKGYLLLTGSCTIRRLLANEDTERETLRLVARYYTDMEKLRNATLEVIAESPLSVRRCDPQEHERGKTFLEFEKLEQGFLVHKSNMQIPMKVTNVQKGREVLTPCEYIDRTPHYANGTGLDWTERLAQIQCPGSVYDCKDARTTSICLSNTPSRRYDGFISGGEPFDKTPHTSGNMSCQEKALEKIDVNFGDKLRPHLEWMKYTSLSGLFAYYHVQEQEPKKELHTCACLCEDLNDPSSFRFVLTTPVWSDINENMVITGFKLVNDSNFLRIEIKQGKLGPHGSINISTNAWKPRTPINNQIPRVLNRHFKTINLNKVTVPLGLAIVGVKFSVTDGSIHPGQLLQLGIFTVPVTYSTGELADPGMNLRYHAPKGPWKELKLDHPNVPTLAPVNKRNMNDLMDYIVLQPSDWDKDAAQSVVPFLDIQEVVTDPPTLLGGLGFSYRSADGYGGFIGLELETWNFTRPLFGPAYNVTDLLIEGNPSVNRTLFPDIYSDDKLVKLLSDKPS